MKKHVLLVTISVFIFIFNGCASHNAAQAPQLGFDLYAQQNKVETHGLILMAKPIHLKSELERYFDNDLLKSGVLPIQIHVLNKSYERPVVFSTDGINLIDPSQARAPMLSGDQLMKKVKKSFWRTAGWSVAFGVFGLIPSAINVSKTNKKIQADYESRMVRGGNLIPGAVTEGTAFFSVPPDISSLNGWKVSLILVDPTKDERIVIEYGLQGTVVPRPKSDESNEGKESDL